MGRAVPELQADALNPRLAVSNLVRRAYTIARKLSLEDLQSWCQKELKGYPYDEKNKPPYRIVNGTLRAFNPYRGYIPVFIEDEDLLKSLAEQFLTEPIAEIEQLIETPEKPIMFSLDERIQRKLMEASGAPFEVRFFLARTQVVRLLEAVRNIILDWTLKLEEGGITGEGFEFTREEKATVRGDVTNYGTIVYGNVANSQLHRDVIGSTLNIASNGGALSELSALIRQISENVVNVPLSQKSADTVGQILEELREEVKNKIPNPNKLASLMHTVKDIFESAVGSLVASGIIYEINRLFPG
jgi:hypothetical protein